MREAVGFDEFVDCGEDVVVAGDVFESCRTVFLDPIIYILASFIRKSIVEAVQGGLPWKRVLSLYWQVCGAPLALCRCAEADIVVCAWNINVHLVIFVVGHICSCGVL